ETGGWAFELPVESELDRRLRHGGGREHNSGGKRCEASREQSAVDHLRTGPGCLHRGLSKTHRYGRARGICTDCRHKTHNEQFLCRTLMFSPRVSTHVLFCPLLVSPRSFGQGPGNLPSSASSNLRVMKCPTPHFLSSMRRNRSGSAPTGMRRTRILTSRSSRR